MEVRTPIGGVGQTLGIATNTRVASDTDIITTATTLNPKGLLLALWAETKNLF
jgi:hypothetical protein